MVKNFQVKHGQCDSIIFPKTFSFKRSKSLLDLCLPDSRILYFWQVLECIHKFIIKPHVLQCLFVRESNKKRRGRIISNFTIGETFHLLWQPSAFEGNLTMWVPFLNLPKVIPFPFALTKNKTYPYTQMKGELTDLFWKLPGCSPFPQAG